MALRLRGFSPEEAVHGLGSNGFRVGGLRVQVFRAVGFSV